MKSGKRIRRAILCVIIAAVIAALSGCAEIEPNVTPTENPSGSPTAAQGTQRPNAAQGTQRPNVEDETGMYVQQPDVTDFTYMWLPKGNLGFYQDTYMMSGNYGLSVNSASGKITRFGAFSSGKDYAAAMLEDNNMITNLPAVDMKYSMRCQGESYAFDQVESLEETGVTTRMLESGRYLQRLDVMCLKTKDKADWYGRMEVVMLPEYFTIAFEVFPQAETCRDAELQFTLELPASYVSFEESLGGRAITVTDADGKGFTAVAPQGVSAKRNGSSLIFTAQGLKLMRAQFNGFNIAVIPSAAAVPADAEHYVAREQVQVSAERLSPKAGDEQKVSYDERGMYSFDLKYMFTVQEGGYTENDLDTYDRVKFTINNPTQHTIKVPLQFIKDSPLSVTGVSPMIRDASTLEPIGVQVQVTRCWHFYNGDPNDSSHIYAPKDSPRRFWEGRWYHGYTVIEVPAGGSVTYEYACAFARWGGVESVTHSQLCLAGWGGNQQWESASLGSYGESFCYDIARSYTWCVMGDICPFGLYSRVDGGKYNWTTNTGGVDFLLADDVFGKAIKYRNFKTFFKKQGPNITEVLYSGMLGDIARVEVSAQMGRTNDVSRATQTFRYTFLEDIAYSRLAFYQFGADSYNYDYWPTMAVGNDDGLIPFTIAGNSYQGLMDVPRSNSNGYLGGQGMDMNCVEVPGSGAWFAFLGAEAGKSNGNKMISVREYRAELNGKVYTQPCFSVRTTSILDWKGAGFELNPPKEVGKKIKAGSTVSFVIEYINLPAHKQDYYGTSSVLNEIPAQDYEGWQLAYTYAVQSNVSVQASVGEAVGNLPPVIRATGTADGVVAQFTITKGIGYVPVTVKNVKGFSGWRLQKKEGSDWKTVDQSVHGNDYWQAWYDAETGTYELTFNVHHNGKNDVGEYRLIKEKA